jgi:hypothetical protein
MSIVTDVVGDLFGVGDAALEAARVQSGAAERGIAETREQLSPFREAGVSALQKQQALLGLSGVGAQKRAFDEFTTSPGQQFMQERARKALLRSSAAIGGLGGGNLKSELQQQAIGFGQQDLQSQLARLSGLSGAGQAAAGQTAENIGNLDLQSGQAQASGILGAQQAKSDFMGQLLNVGAGAGLGAMTKGVGAGKGALLGLF